MAENEKSQDQKTEEPTPRRLQKAMEEGQMAFSSELLGGLAILIGMFFFLLVGRWFFELIKDSIRQRLTFVDPMITHPETILLAMRRDLTQIGIGCLCLMVPIAMVTLLVGFLQTRFNITTKPLTIDFNKLQPSKGLKRIFSTRSLNRGLVAIAKATAITVAAYLLTVARLDQINAATTFTFGYAIQTGTELILAVGFLSAALMVIVGVIDYGFQRWKHHQEMKMSLQEVRDELKETEGDPQIKARMRRLQQEMRKNRMLGDVPNADVTITNPTHFAVSLRYNAGKDEAPVVVAKGADFLAKKIIEISKKNNVPVVERKPVARFLYANVEVGQEIPYELYQAVAEILNFVKKLQRRAG